MKKVLLLFVAMIMIGAFQSSSINTGDLRTNSIVKEGRVYVCGGKYATKFHSSTKCRGLNNCKSDIYYYDSQKDALDAGYKHCLICWK
jgi:hypothetical protein